MEVSLAGNNKFIFCEKEDETPDHLVMECQRKNALD